MLRTHSSLLATLRVGVSTDIAEVVNAAEARGQLTIVSGNIHEMRPVPDGNGLAVRYTPTGAVHDKTMRCDYAISCLGRDMTTSGVLRTMIDQGQAAEHFTGLGIQVGANGQVIDQSGQRSQQIIAVGPMRAGDALERNGLIGPPAFSVPGMRQHIADSASLALARLPAQAEVPLDPQKTFAASVKSECSTSRGR